MGAGVGVGVGVAVGVDVGVSVWVGARVAVGIAVWDAGAVAEGVASLVCGPEQASAIVAMARMIATWSFIGLISNSSSLRGLTKEGRGNLVAGSTPPPDCFVGYRLLAMTMSLK